MGRGLRTRLFSSARNRDLVANYETKRPVTTQTVFQIASLTIHAFESSARPKLALGVGDDHVSEREDIAASG